MRNLTNRAGKGYGIWSNAKNILDKIGNSSSYGNNTDDFIDLTRDKEDINPRKYKKALDSANGINPLYNEREGKTRQDNLERRELDKWEKSEQRTLQKAEEMRKEEIRKHQKKEAEALRRKMSPNGYISADEVMKNLQINNNKYEDMLYKKDRDITESEANMTNRYTWFDSKDKDLNDKLNNRLKQRNEAIYGTQGSQDVTGRSIRPDALIAVRKEAVDLRTPDNHTMDSVYSQVSKKIANKEDGARYLQTKLNDYDLNPKLKVDGDIGPKTTSGLKYAAATYGLNSVLRKIA